MTFPTVAGHRVFVRDTLLTSGSLWCADRLSASIDGPALQRSYALSRPFVLIGASPDCDIVVPLRDIPPVALCLLMTHDAAHWIDLTSSYGQWRSGPFDRSGCLVWRGYHLDLQRVRDEADSAATSHPLTDGGPDSDGRLADIPTFDVSFDGERLARAKLTHTLTLVGQSDRCRLRLRNRHVAPEHCLLYVAGRRAWVIDLLSDKGTYLRGRRISVGEVHAGDVVTVGKPHLTMLRWSRRSTDAGSSSDILIGAPGRDDAARTIELDTCDAAAASESLSPSVPTQLSPRVAGQESAVADALRETTFDIESLRTTKAEVTPPSAISAVAVAATEDQSPETPAAAEQELQNAVMELSLSELPLLEVETNSEAQPRGAANSAGESVTKLPVGDLFPADSEPVKLLPPPQPALTPASAGSLTADLVVGEEAIEGAAMHTIPHRIAQLQITQRRISALLSEEALAADQALNRLIVRHRHHHRKRALVWTTVGSIVLGAFLTGVHWATENVNFHDVSFDFNLEIAPPPASNTSPTPSQQRASANEVGSDVLAETDPLE